MQGNRRPLPWVRFNVRRGVGAVKSLDSLEDIMHGHASAAALGSVYIDRPLRYLEKVRRSLLAHAHAVVGHLD